MTKILTSLDKEKILTLYNENILNKDIANLIGVSKATIGNFLKTKNLYSKYSTPRKYSLNESFFDEIDTEEKAYFLGFLYADGYNLEKKGRISMNLKENDKEILEKFSRIIESDRPLTFIDVVSYKKRVLNSSNQYKITINSKHMSLMLKVLGCMQTKSLILKFPTEEQVPSYLLRHFLRGYSDGDGWIGDQSLCIVGTEDFCNSLGEKVKKDLNINFYIRKREKEKNTTTRMFYISGRRQLMIFLNYIYNDSTIYLQRKYDIWEKNKLWKRKCSVTS